jgi:sugar phosphate isomerase/epimerase
MSVPVVFGTGSLHAFGIERVYSWAAEVGFDGVEIMIDDRWDTHQSGYLDRLAENHGIPILALHPPLRGDVTLDSSHVGASKVDLMRAYSMLAGQLRHVHLSDSDLTGADQHRLLGKGRLPLRPFLAVLAQSEYTGVVSLELKPWPLGPPEPETILKRMRGALEFARRVLGDHLRW